MIGQPMQPNELRSQTLEVAPPPYAGSVSNTPRSYPNLFVNERKAGEPFFLELDDSPTIVTAGAIVDTRIRATQSYWYEIDYFVVTLVPNAGAQAGVGSTQYPFSIQTRLASGDLSPIPDPVPLFGAASDGRRWQAKLPVSFVLKTNSDMQIFLRNDGSVDMQVFMSFRGKRHLSNTGGRK